MTGAATVIASAPAAQRRVRRIPSMNLRHLTIGPLMLLAKLIQMGFICVGFFPLGHDRNYAVFLDKVRR
jgi:hypothetical protein